MASGDQLKVEPPTATFNAPFKAARITHSLTNSGSTRLTFKVKCTHPDLILANPVFGIVEGGQSAKLNLHGRFKTDPDPKAAYRVYIQFAEVPADMTPGDQAKIRAGWGGIKEPKTIKLVVGYSPPPAEAAPPAAEAAPAAEAPAE